MRCSLVITAKPVDLAGLLAGTNANSQPDFDPLRSIYSQIGILQQTGGESTVWINNCP